MDRGSITEMLVILPRFLYPDFSDFENFQD